jgi:tRNA threonylcarbamoyladenosine biosynthesis protein TsaB
MLILALDSAGQGCSACVWHDGKVLAAAHEPMERGQDRRLMPLVLEIMKKANVEFAALDRITCTRGPGSFTGIRIGLAAARGIGLASGKPVIGIDRFSIFREQIKTQGKNLLVVINAKRKELFCRFYPAREEATEAVMITPDEIRAYLSRHSETIVTGDIELEGLFTPASENEVITCAALAARADVNDPIFLPRPLYIRPPDITMKKAAHLIRAVSVDDAPLLSRIHIESFGAAGWNAEQMKGSLALATTRGWMALQGAEPIGFILCQITPGQSEVLTFCVRPSYRRRGAGVFLLQQAIATIHDEGNAVLLLEAASDNLAARKLYEKLGFTTTGKRANYYRRGTGTTDAVLYTLAADVPLFASPGRAC